MKTDFEEDKESEDKESKKSTRSGMTEIARRLLLTGLGAVFMTEETIRKLLGDVKIPKDAMGYFLETAIRQKNELMGMVAGELSKFLSKVKIHEELQRALSGLQLNVDAKIQFSQNKVEHPTKITLQKSSQKTRS